MTRSIVPFVFAIALAVALGGTATAQTETERKLWPSEIVWPVSCFRIKSTEWKDCSIGEATKAEARLVDSPDHSYRVILVSATRLDLGESWWAKIDPTSDVFLERHDGKYPSGG